jgi:DNA-directed RNA polymerase specialized sigma54-like protein
VYSHGHWTWKKSPATVNETICPACQRMIDQYPAGFVELKGEFLNHHREEILNLVANIENLEKNERPLERIMAIKDQKIHTLITTTGIHIARRIGEAINHSYQGELLIQYSDAENCIRVYWKR